MQFANFDEFWAALGRLYDEILEMKESIEKLRRTGEQAREDIRGLTEASKLLLSAAEKHQQIVDSHERRLDRTEVTVEAILEDLRRHREQRPSQ